MKLPICIYGEETDWRVATRKIYDQLRKLTEKSIDGFNLDTDFAGNGLEWSVPNNSVLQARRLVNSLADSGGNAFIRRKGDGASPENFYGMEVVVDAAQATYGRFCVIDKDFLSRQLISLIPQDPATVADPGGIILTPRGTLTTNTGGAFNQILQRNSVTQLTLDGTNLVSNDRHVIPVTTNTADIGTTSLGWREIYTRTIDSDGDNNLILQRNNVTGLTLTSGSLTIPVGTDIRPSSNSTIAMAFANAAGTDQIVFDTINGRISVGKSTAPGTTLDVAGDVTIAQSSDIRPSTDSTTAIGIANAAGIDFATFDTTNSRFRIGSSGAPNTTLDVRGNITILSGSDIRPTANATNAINIANAAGTDFVTFDTTNSRVGIGVAAPVSTLDIRNGGGVRVQFSVTDGTTASAMIRAGASDHGVLASDVALRFRTGASLLNADSGGTTVMTMSTTGRVGIGDPAPAERVDVLGSTGRFSMRTDSNTMVNLHIRPNAGQAGWHTYTENAVADRWSVGIRAADARLYYATGNSSVGTEVNRAVFDGNGLFGVGTISPLVRIHATTDDAVTAAVTDILQLNHSSSLTPAASFGTGLLFTGESSTTDARNMARIQSRWTTATDASRASALDFQTLTGAGSLTTRVTIDGSGNIVTTGGTDIRPNANSTTAINIANAAGTDFGIFDSTNLRFGIGSETAPHSTLTSGGSFAATYLRVTVDTTLTAAHFFVTVGSAAGVRTITLPTAVGISGRMYIIKRDGVNSVTVDADGTEVIDGSLTATIGTDLGTLIIISDGVNWVKATGII